MQVPIERDDCLAMVWPSPEPPPVVDVDSRYTLRVGIADDDFRSVQESIGFDVTSLHWDEIVRTVSHDHIVFGVAQDGTPVAVAVAQLRSGAGHELGWVAVAPPHRGHGLGLALCRALTRHVALGGGRVFLSTQDDRLAALRIYFEIGFHPVFRPLKKNRWRAVCSKISVPFSPSTWNWPI